MVKVVKNFSNAGQPWNGTGPGTTLNRSDFWSRNRSSVRGVSQETRSGILGPVRKREFYKQLVPRDLRGTAARVQPGVLRKIRMRFSRIARFFPIGFVQAARGGGSPELEGFGKMNAL